MAAGLLRKIVGALGARTAVRVESAIRNEPEQPDTPAVSAIISRLREIVVQHGDGVVLAENVGSGDHLFDSGHVDSMSGIALLTFVEDHYDVLIEGFELVDSLSSLRALATHIDEQQSAPQSA